MYTIVISWGLRGGLGQDWGLWVDIFCCLVLCDLIVGAAMGLGQDLGLWVDIFVLLPIVI